MQFIEAAADGSKDFSAVKAGEVVILPAFGASVQEMRLLADRDVQIVDTTCPWVRCASLAGWAGKWTGTRASPARQLTPRRRLAACSWPGDAAQCPVPATTAIAPDAGRLGRRRALACLPSRSCTACPRLPALTCPHLPAVLLRPRPLPACSPAARCGTRWTTRRARGTPRSSTASGTTRRPSPPPPLPVRHRLPTHTRKQLLPAWPGLLWLLECLE